MTRTDSQIGIVPYTFALLTLLALFGVAGCAKSEPAKEAPTAPPQATASSGGEAPCCAGHRDMRAVCPMGVPGTTATAEDVEGGATLALTTTGDKVELQRRARAFADMQVKHAAHAGAAGHACDPASCPMHGKVAGGEPDAGAAAGPAAAAGPGAGHHGHHGHDAHHAHHGHDAKGHHGGGCCGAGCCGPAMAGANTTVEDTDTGARVVYRAADATQVDALREHVRDKADKLMHCPMRAQAAPPPAS